MDNRTGFTSKSTVIRYSTIILLLSVAALLGRTVAGEQFLLIMALPVLTVGLISGPLHAAGFSIMLFLLDIFVSHARGGVPAGGVLQHAGNISSSYLILLLPGLLGGFIVRMRIRKVLETESQEKRVSPSDYNRLQQKLQNSEKNLTFVRHAANLATWEYFINSGSFTPSPETSGLLELEKTSLRDGFSSLLAVIHPDDRENVENSLMALTDGESIQIEHRAVLPGGREKIFRQNVRRLAACEPEGPVLSAVLQDITREKHNEEELRKLTLALQNAKDWIIITDAKGKIEYVNTTVLEISGYAMEDVLQSGIGTWRSGVHSRDFYKVLWDTILRGESFRSLFICRKKNAELFYLDQTIIPVSDSSGRITHFIGTGKDVTQAKQMEERLNYLSYYDVLTNLPNRQLFIERVRQSVSYAQKSSTSLMVMSLDINRFRLINDSYGPKVGDEILKGIAVRLNVSLREGDTVARLGNDEWGVVLTRIKQTKDIVQVVDRILSESGKPFSIDGEDIVVTLSAGIALYPEDGRSASELIRHSEIALIKAKEEGKNHYQFYTNELNQQASDFVQMERNLFRALENGEFIIYFQPYFHIETRELAGMEALLRWKKQDSIMSPAEFIPILEETGMIVEAGEQVIRLAAGYIRQWLDQGYEVKPVSLNLSAMQFHQKSLADTIEKIIKEYEVDPSYIMFEITETTFMQDLEHTRATLTRLRNSGFSLSIDDFGTGYSSLSYLKRFPINILKIDKSFVVDLSRSSDDLSIVKAVISIAKSLHLKTVAEGVEDEAALKILQEEGCDYAQGYYFTPPVPPLEVEKILIERSNNRLRSQ